MRNILAHEILNCNFTDKEVIEKLSDGNISNLKYEWFAQKIIIALALIAFIVFMGYTITGSMGLH